MTEGTQRTGSDDTAVRAFQVGFPEAELTELRRRVNATRWPERETVTDDSQGVRLAMMQDLARYWETHYDWGKCEAKLNTLPNFLTEIDGLDIHFIHVRSQHEDALPLIVTHGWPGSIIEPLKIIEPLTNPTAHGASAADAFDLVIPSLPGHGFSAKPATTGWNPARIARAWVVLMKRLGYTQFVAQGGDWGRGRHAGDGEQAALELAGVRDGSWAVVNATEYSDLETVAAGVVAGASFLFRTGPSFVRALTGMGPRAPLRGADICAGRTAPAGRARPGRGGVACRPDQPPAVGAARRGRDHRLRAGCPGDRRRRRGGGRDGTAGGSRAARFGCAAVHQPRRGHGRAGIVALNQHSSTCRMPGRSARSCCRSSTAARRR